MSNSSSQRLLKRHRDLYRVLVEDERAQNLFVFDEICEEVWKALDKARLEGYNEGYNDAWMDS